MDAPTLAPGRPRRRTTPRLGGVLLTAARCGLRHRHAWQLVAVGSPLPAQGLPAQYRRICRDCGDGGCPAPDNRPAAG